MISFVDWMGVYFPKWKMHMDDDMIPVWECNGHRDDKTLNDLHALFCFEIEHGYIKETDDEGFVTRDNVVHLGRM